MDEEKGHQMHGEVGQLGEVIDENDRESKVGL